jgi:hypothetical protein
MGTQSKHNVTQENAEAAREGRDDSRLWESFPEPAGWSVRWDGLELDRAMQMTDEGENQAQEGAEQ